MAFPNHHRRSLEVQEGRSVSHRTGPHFGLHTCPRTRDLGPRPRRARYYTTRWMSLWPASPPARKSVTVVVCDVEFHPAGGVRGGRCYISRVRTTRRCGARAERLGAWCSAGRISSGSSPNTGGATAKASGAEVTGVCTRRRSTWSGPSAPTHAIDHTKDDFAHGEQRYDLILDIGGNSSLARLRRALTPKERL
jgi:hypothetical protein